MPTSFSKEAELGIKSTDLVTKAMFIPQQDILMLVIFKASFQKESD